MADKVETICPDCWNAQMVDLEIDELIICSECDFEYYEYESLAD